MLKVKYFYFIVFPFVLAAAEPSRKPDLSTPRKALEAEVKADEKGGLECFSAVCSKQCLNELREMSVQFGVKIEDAMLPSKPYEKLEVLREDIVENRAGLYVRLKYTADWIKENDNGKYDDTTVRDDGTVVSGGGRLESLATSLGSMFTREYPCHKGGIGYAVYFFVKESDEWRADGGCTFRTEIDPMKFRLYKSFLKNGKK